MRRAPLILATLALAACQPETKPVSDAEAMGQDEPGAPMEPAPDPTPVTFPALSRNAQAVTGAVSLSAQPRPGPNSAARMKITTATGLVFETELLPGAAEEAKAIDWKSIFGVELVTSGNPPPGAPSVDMHSVAMETVPKEATQGGFCGAEPTAYLAMATGLEISGQKMMKLAAFKGAVWPPETAAALCGAFVYAPPGLPQ